MKSWFLWRWHTQVSTRSTVHFGWELNCIKNLFSELQVHYFAWRDPAERTMLCFVCWSPACNKCLVLQLEILYQQSLLITQEKPYTNTEGLLCATLHCVSVWLLMRDSVMETDRWCVWECMREGHIVALCLSICLFLWVSGVCMVISSLGSEVISLEKCRDLDTMTTRLLPPMSLLSCSPSLFLCLSHSLAFSSLLFGPLSTFACGNDAWPRKTWFGKLVKTRKSNNPVFHIKALLEMVSAWKG